MQTCMNRKTFPYRAVVFYSSKIMHFFCLEVANDYENETSAIKMCKLVWKKNQLHVTLMNLIQVD